MIEITCRRVSILVSEQKSSYPSHFRRNFALLPTVHCHPTRVYLWLGYWRCPLCPGNRCFWCCPLCPGMRLFNIA